jgi:hypothetical protein
MPGSYHSSATTPWRDAAYWRTVRLAEARERSEVAKRGGLIDGRRVPYQGAIVPPPKPGRRLVANFSALRRPATATATTTSTSSAQPKRSQRWGTAVS